MFGKFWRATAVEELLAHAIRREPPPTSGVDMRAGGGSLELAVSNARADIASFKLRAQSIAFASVSSVSRSILGIIQIRERHLASAWGAVEVSPTCFGPSEGGE